MVKLIALDMDGTLLTPDHDISGRTREAGQKAMDRGVQVVIATGRAFYEAHGIISKLDMNVPYICLNGAEVRNESSEIMSTSALNSELIDEVSDVFKAEGIFYQIYTDRAIYTTSIERDIEVFIDLSEQMGQKANETRIRKFMEERLDAVHSLKWMITRRSSREGTRMSSSSWRLHQAERNSSGRKMSSTKSVTSPCHHHLPETLNSPMKTPRKGLPSNILRKLWKST